MIDGLKPYPAMKDSGVPWLGEVPEHWEVRRLKHVCAMRSGDGITAEAINADGDYPVYGGNGRRGFTSSFTHDGEFPLVGRQGALCGNVHLARGQFWASEHAVVASPESGVSPSFLAQALRILDLRQYSIAAAQPGLAVERILTLPAPLPPLPEQAAIVRFLDHADRRIRRYIRAKQKLVKLLEEQKQAIIHRAVTRGLDTNVRLKPSGVEWLGDVPAHWEVIKLSRWFKCTSGSTPSRSVGGYYGGDIPWIKTGELLNGEIRSAVESITQKGLRETNLTLLPAETLLIAMYGQGQTRGRTGLLKIAATVNQAALGILPNPARANTKYLQLWFIAHYTVLRHLSEARNATQPNLNGEIIKSLKIALPPLLEQERIMQAVEVETTTIVAASDRAQQEIALLREYRTRLIADVVTGKLDVREAAARLPDEVPEAETEDDLDEVAEGDDAAGPGSDIDTEPENEAA